MLKLLKIITGLLFVGLSIPFIGRMIDMFIPGEWIILPILLIVILIMSIRAKAPYIGSIVGLVACLFGFIPIVGSILFFATGIILLIEVFRPSKNVSSETITVTPVTEGEQVVASTDDKTINHEAKPAENQDQIGKIVAKAEVYGNKAIEFMKPYYEKVVAKFMTKPANGNGEAVVEGAAPSQQLNKKLIFLIAGITGVFLLVGAVTSTSSEELYENLTTAASTNDVEMFLNECTKEVQDADFAEVGAEALMASFTESGYSYNGVFSVIEDRHFIVFKDCQVSAPLVYVSVDEEVEGVTVTLNGEEFPEEGATLIEGEYTFVVSEDLGYCTITDEITQDVGNGNGTISTDGAHGYEVEIPAGSESVTVNYNGVDTGMTLLPEEEQTLIIPSDEDMSKVTLAFELPGIESKEVSLENLSYGEYGTSFSVDMSPNPEPGTIAIDTAYFNDIYAKTMKEEDAADKANDVAKMTNTTAEFQAENKENYANVRSINYSLKQSIFDPQKSSLEFGEDGEIYVILGGYTHYVKNPADESNYYYEVELHFIFDQETNTYLLTEIQEDSMYYSYTKDDYSEYAVIN